MAAMTVKRANRQLSCWVFGFVSLLVSQQALADTASIETTFSSIVKVLASLNSSMNAIWFMLVGMMYTLGIYFSVSAMMKLKKFGQRNAFMQVSASLIGPAATLLIGVMLMYFPTTLKVMLSSVYETPELQEFSYNQSTQGSFWTSAILQLKQVIQVVGLIAFIRGWILLVRSTGENSPPGTAGKGVMHVLGGLMAINIVGTVDVINSTFR